MDLAQRVRDELRGADWAVLTPRHVLRRLVDAGMPDTPEARRAARRALRAQLGLPPRLVRARLVRARLDVGAAGVRLALRAR